MGGTQVAVPWEIRWLRILPQSCRQAGGSSQNLQSMCRSFLNSGGLLFLLTACSSALKSVASFPPACAWNGLNLDQESGG